ncbi:nucleotide-diphosphate-sugar epimerase [Sphaerisporangium rufum]|uniref:Nucleotide-diphosphate-sugar epimerase n=1 Tax=Sphaerisporangium rufum TaxID=1381558 RepID=A0A919QX80_9ACTN|nr:NAD(P)H-binding protein [Sphaerisporangium rufum]GII75786.1 nucleotide-diphosphate-sugar epimerase [Sphaerisporangium rufum]
MILVTGATGNVGRHVVQMLLERGAKVRALTRDPARADLPAAAGVARGDLADPGSLDAALDGVDTVFLVWPTLAADHAAPATIAALAARARRIVYLSTRGVTPDTEPVPGSILGSHALLERLIAGSGAAHTFLRPGGFAANTLMWAPQIRQTGDVHWVYGDAGRSLIHERDIAAVAAHVLTTPGHDGAVYELTGPETLTQAEQAAAIGEAIGRPVRWVELDPGQAREQMVAGGMPVEMAATIIAGQAAMVAAPEPVLPTVERLIGRPATPYARWARDHADDFR